MRVSEACGYIEQVDTGSRVLHVARLNGGLSTTHPLRGDELRATKVWLAEQSAVPCGYALADQGADTRLIQDYLGHRNIQYTVCYTATNSAHFVKLWR